MTSAFLRAIAALPCLAALAGCSTLGYYGQAVGGHLSLMTGREPIDEMVHSDEVSPEVRARLRAVRDIRDFASGELDLPDNRSYRYYSHLDRPYVVWNVVATPVDSLKPRRWCFPFAGCVSYRGYFSREGAEKFAAGLREQGLDVAVTGATAYSTLGWFADPVLSTMLDYPDPELAGLIFHELAHQRLYVKGDTAFNEAFATTVEETGVRRWLQSRDDAGALAGWERRQRHQQDFTDLIMDVKQELEKLYARSDGMDRETLLARKRALFDGLRERYAELSRGWQSNPYQAWMNRDLNNAHLALVSAYRSGVPAFRRLLACEGNDLKRFYRAAERVSEWPAEERDEWLSSTQSAGRSCAGPPAR